MRLTLNVRKPNVKTIDLEGLAGVVSLRGLAQDQNNFNQPENMQTNNFLKSSLASVALILFCQASRAQTFQNLDFEGQWSDYSIPDWTANYYPYNLPNGGYQSYPPAATSLVWPNDQAPGNIDQSSIGLIDDNSTAYGPTVIDGSQSLYISTAEAFNGGEPSSISQVGTIPKTAKSILFLAADLGTVSSGSPPMLGLSFGGNQLSVQEVLPPTSGGVIEYGADLSAYSGQTGELTLSLSGADVWGEIDDIQFSAATVPETKAFPIVTAGICMALICFRRGRTAA